MIDYLQNRAIKDESDIDIIVATISITDDLENLGMMYAIFRNINMIEKSRANYLKFQIRIRCVSLQVLELLKLRFADDRDLAILLVDLADETKRRMKKSKRAGQ